MTEPCFPLRVIYSDGAALVIAEPEELFDHFDTVDSLAERATLWIRDDLGRTVDLKMRNGIIDRLAAV